MSQVEQCLCREFAGIEGDVWILRTEGTFGFFEPREALRSFAAREIYCLKLV